MAYQAPAHGFDYDYFVIGGGSGGVRSSRIAASHGAKVIGVPLQCKHHETVFWAVGTRVLSLAEHV